MVPQLDQPENRPGSHYPPQHESHPPFKRQQHNPPTQAQIPQTNPLITAPQAPQPTEGEVEAEVAPNPPTYRTRPYPRPHAHTYTLRPLFSEYATTLSTLKSQHKSTFKTQLSAQHKHHAQALAHISAHHTAKLQTLDNSAQTLLQSPLRDVQLSFSNSAGVVKGTANVDARVTAFRTRVAEVRGLVDGLVSERGVVELSIAGLIAELTELTEPVGVMSGGGCDGVEWDERQAVVMDEVEACADDAMKAWGEVESEVRDRRVRCRDGVGRVLRELNGMFDE